MTLFSSDFERNWAIFVGPCKCGGPRTGPAMRQPSVSVCVVLLPRALHHFPTPGCVQWKVLRAHQVQPDRQEN